MKTYEGADVQIHVFLTSALRCGDLSGQLRAPIALPSGKGPQYQLHRGLGGPKRRSARYGEENKSIVSAGNRTSVPQPSGPEPDAIPAELSANCRCRVSPPQSVPDAVQTEVCSTG
jgi:hypothetical protein